MELAKDLDVSLEWYFKQMAKQNSALGKIAGEAHRVQGLGAVIVKVPWDDIHERKQCNLTVAYGPHEIVQGINNQQAIDLVRTYDPSEQYVLIIMTSDGDKAYLKSKIRYM